MHAALGGLRGSGAVGVRPDRRLTTGGAAADRAHPAGPGHPLGRPPALPGPGPAAGRARTHRAGPDPQRPGAARAADERHAARPRPPLEPVPVRPCWASACSGCSPACSTAARSGYLLLTLAPSSCVGPAAAPGTRPHPGRSRRPALRPHASTPTSRRPRRPPTPPTGRPARRWAWPCTAPPRSGRSTRASPSRPRSNARPLSGSGGWTGGSDGSSGGGGDSSGGDGGSSCGGGGGGCGAAAGAADDRPVRGRHRLASGDRRLRRRAARPALRRGGRRGGARLRAAPARPDRSCGTAR